MLLDGRYSFTADRVTFAADVVGNVSAADEVAAADSTFNGAFAFVSGQGSCPPNWATCRLDVGGGGNRFLGHVTMVRMRHPRPTSGIFVAITVMNCTLAWSGRVAM
jgi:hypothetical protein